MSFSFREFRDPDFDTLWQIDQKCFAAGIAYSRAELAFYIGRRGSFTLIAEQSAGVSPRSSSPSILGFIVAESRKQFGHIVTIDVLPEARRRRTGSALLAAAETELRGRNCREVRLETAVDNKAALAFYKRHGYAIWKV